MNVGIEVLERESADANRVVASDIFAVGCVFAARRGPINAAVPIFKCIRNACAYLGGTHIVGGRVDIGAFDIQ